MIFAPALSLCSEIVVILEQHRVSYGHEGPSRQGSQSLPRLLFQDGGTRRGRGLHVRPLHRYLPACAERGILGFLHATSHGELKIRP